MTNWEFEIVIGTPGEVREGINRLGALGWEIAATDALQSDEQPALVVYMKRQTGATVGEPRVQETEGVDLSEFPLFRPHA